jgi:pimeloyl-ACP methyl ester carboxylesterase
MTEQPAIVLVHGAWGSPEMWNFVIEALPRGLDIVVADLPTCSRVGATLADDAAHVRELAGARPVIVVGHSYGGAVITEAAAAIPGVQHLLYLAAAMPGVGESMFEWITKRPVPDMPLEFAADGTSMLNFAGVELPYDELTIARLDSVRLRPFVIGAVMTPLTSAAWTTVPTTYVVAEQDTTIHPDTQREMASRAGSVIELDAEHQVIFSHPEQVAAIIADLVAG